MIKIYETMYLEREKIKVLGLVGPIDKRGYLSTYCNPLWLTYSPLSYLVLALLLCVPLA